MVLSREATKKASEEIINNPFGFMVLDTKRLRYSHQVTKFKYATEVLGFIHIVDALNKAMKKADSPKVINTEILYKAIESIIEESNFTDAQIIKFVDEVVKIEELARILEDICDTEFFMPYEVEYLLLGATAKEIACVIEDKKGELDETYGDLWFRVRNKEITIKEYIKEAKELMTVFKQPIEVSA